MEAFKEGQVSHECLEEIAFSFRLYVLEDYDTNPKHWHY
jgi:hypothetical protein